MGKKSDRSEVWEEPENPLSPEAACLTIRASGKSALPKAGFLQPWKKRVPFVSHSTNVFFFQQMFTAYQSSAGPDMVTDSLHNQI